MDRPPEPHSTPSTSAKPTQLQRMPTEQSLESFSITTTPFHEPDEDGEYYMDEAGDWLQRWVTKTEVKAAKVSRSRPDSGYAMGEGATSRKNGTSRSLRASDEAGSLASSHEGATMESSESSAEQRHEIQEQASRGRPMIRRSSGSSVIPAERANHRSPAASSSPRITGGESAGTTPRQIHVQQFTPQPPPPLDASVITVQDIAPCSSDMPEPALHTFKALSCPSSPRQVPVPLSMPPSPTHVRRSSQGQPTRPLLRTGASTGAHPTSRRGSTTVSRLERTSTMPTGSSFTTVITPSPPLSGASSYARLRTARTGSTAGDAYAAHREALAIFSPQSANQSRESKEKEKKERRVMAAADFLANRPEEIVPLDRPASKSSGDDTLRSLSSGSGPEDEARATAGSRKDIEAGRKVVLHDHDVTIDWTHPETRRRREEKERRKTKGLRGKMRKLICFGSKDDGSDDACSVRRLKLH